MVVEFNKVVITDGSGRVVSDTSDLKIENGRMSGLAVKNLKEEVIKEIDEEIIKPQNENIRRELEELREAVSSQDKPKTKRILKKILDKGEDLLLDLAAKIIVESVKS